MYRLTDWIEPVLVESLGRYLSPKNSKQRQKAVGRRFQIVEELSNLCIRLSANKYLLLAEFRPSDGNVEALLADYCSRVETVFPRDTVDLWQEKNQRILANLPSRSLFHILKSEFRISDCFFPPKIELWVYSFKLVGDLGNRLPPPAKDIDLSTNLRRLLNLYVESKERSKDQRGTKNVEAKAIATDDTPMNSPLQSQVGSLSDDQDGYDDVADIENREGKTLSQAFHTQISQPPAIRQYREALSSKQPYASQEYRSIRKRSVQETFTQQVERREQASSSIASGKINDFKPPSTQIGSPLQRNQEDEEAASGSQKSIMATGKGGSASMNASHWSIRRTRLQNQRYVPRYLTKISKSQQEMLESDNAWQPSKVDRQIRGSVPNDILLKFADIADEAPNNASDDNSSKPTEKNATTAPGEIRDALCGESMHILQDGSDTDRESSSSEESEHLEWSSSPIRPLCQESKFPDNSSQTEAPRRCGFQELPPTCSSAAKADDVMEQDAIETKSVPARSPGETYECNDRKALRGPDVKQLTQTQSVPLQGTPATGAQFKSEGFDTRNISAGHRSSSCPDQRQLQDGAHSRLSSSDSGVKKASSREVSLLSPLQIRKEVNSEISVGKPQIQVQRTPFVHHPAQLNESLDYPRDESPSPCMTAGEAVPEVEEFRSPRSVVQCTFVNGETQRCIEAENSTKICPHSDSGSSEDELMEKQDTNEMMDISKASVAMSEKSPQRSHSRRVTKRKRIGDNDVTEKRQSYQQISERGSSSTPSKKARKLSTFQSLDALKDLDTAKRPSEIARESRRQFFRGQEKTPMTSSPRLTTIDVLQKPQREEHYLLPHALGHEATPSVQQIQSTAGISMVSKAERGVNTTLQLSLKELEMFESFKAAYPEYEGSASQFHKACMQIKALHTDGKDPHPSLWDDFIFRRHHDYREYLLAVTESGEDAIPYLQYYREYVELPSRMLLVIRPFFILSLGSDSTLGSSVKGPPIGSYIESKTAANVEDSAGASSSASNIRTGRHASSPTIAYKQRRQQGLGHGLNSQEKMEPEHTQGSSSVEQWVVLQSRDKVLGAESLELDYAAEEVGDEDVPLQKLDDSPSVVVQEMETSDNISASSVSSHQPAISKFAEKEALWCDDPETPFKQFASSYVNLASERKRLGRTVEIDGKGCLEPQLQDVIDIFTLYRK